MISRLQARALRPGVFGLSRVAMVAAALALALTGCGDKKDKPSSQTAAKVNKEEITVHQINYVLQQQRGLAPEQAASAGKQVLERLVDQELALQKAQELKLDRDPRVVQQIEAARREIIARAYLERIGGGATKPSAAEVKAYYDAHPALFSQRRVYNLQELNIQAKPEQLAALQARLAASKDIPDFVNYLKANDFRFSANQAVRTAEQLPLTSLDKFAQMKDGQNLFNAMPGGAQVLVLAGSRSQPVDEARAVPAIEQFLLNERKRKVIDDDLKALRSGSKIEYVGEYAKAAGATAPAAAASEAPAFVSVTPAMPSGPIPSAAPQVEIAPTSMNPASAPAEGTIEKGMKGFK